MFSALYIRWRIIGSLYFSHVTTIPSYSALSWHGMSTISALKWPIRSSANLGHVTQDSRILGSLREEEREGRFQLGTTPIK